MCPEPCCLPRIADGPNVLSGVQARLTSDTDDNMQGPPSPYPDTGQCVAFDSARYAGWLAAQDLEPGQVTRLIRGAPATSDCMPVVCSFPAKAHIAWRTVKAEVQGDDCYF